MHTLAGSLLGHIIPKSPIEYIEFSMGKVTALRVGNKQMLSMVTATVHPFLNIAQVQSLPHHEEKFYRNLAPHFPGVWETMQARAFFEANNACQVTGTSGPGAGLEVVPQWRYNVCDRRVEFVGLMVVCSAVRIATSVINHTESTPERSGLEIRLDSKPEDRAFIMQLQKWDEGSMQAHIRFVRERQVVMDTKLLCEAWKVSLTSGLAEAHPRDS